MELEKVHKIQQYGQENGMVPIQPKKKSLFWKDEGQKKM